MKILKIWKDTIINNFKMRIKNMENNKTFDKECLTINRLKKY